MKLYAIPVMDKHGGKIRPIQDYSLPLNSLSNKKINIIRIYASKGIKENSENKTHFEYAEEFYQSLEQKWILHCESVKKTMEEWLK